MGNSPEGIGFSPDGNRVYVADSNDSSVAVIDATTSPPSLIGYHSAIANPIAVAVTPDNGWVYAVNYGNQSVSVFPNNPPPHVSSITNPSGPEAGGNTVTLSGTNLTGATSVAFGSTDGTNVAVNGPGTQLTVTAPSGTGTQPVVVNTADAQSAPVNYTYVAPLAVTTTSVPGGDVGVAYSTTLAATGGTSPYTWAVDPATLPAGLSLNASTGVISGTPSATGASNFTVTVTDSTSPTPMVVTQPLQITISTTPSFTSSNTLPDGIAETPYSVNLNSLPIVTGGTGPYSWVLSSGPPGFTIAANSSVLSNPSPTAGFNQLTLKAVDAAGCRRHRGQRWW